MALLLVSTLCSGEALAAVQVNLSKDVELLAVNGEEIGLRLFSKSELQLEDGLNQFVVRASKLVRQANGEFEKFNSDPVIITFDAKDQKIQLSPQGDIATTTDADNFNKQPYFTLSSSSPNIQVEQELLPRGPGITRDYEKEIARFNAQRNITIDKASKESQFSEKQIDSTEKATSVGVKSNSLKVVKDQYLMLTEEERKQFLSWAVAQ
ncbi:YccT family protein [Vibrio navarrensis]